MHVSQIPQNGILVITKWFMEVWHAARGSGWHHMSSQDMN